MSGAPNHVDAGLYPVNTAPRGCLLLRGARGAVLRSLQSLRTGSLAIVEGPCEWHFGGGPPEPMCTIRVHDERFWTRVLTRGALGAGEAYRDGYWSADDLTRVIQLMIGHPEALGSRAIAIADGVARWVEYLATARPNSRHANRRQIAAHYDLGNEFYELWLDETLAYSSGLFLRPEATLREASIAKFDRICRRLQLRPGDRLLEIGCGWGGFAMHAAAEYGCHVTAVTISRRQHEAAAQRVADAGLSARVQILLRDYRDLSDEFDKLVSIEMIEAVGWRNLPVYLRQVSRLLKPDGAAMIQAITIADRYYESAKRRVDFIKRYIFPGSTLPSLEVLARHTARCTDLTIREVFDLTSHYAATLRLWRERFRERIADVRALGFDDAFLRAWTFYLCYCEGGFLERVIGDAQILFEKPQSRLTLAP